MKYTKTCPLQFKSVKGQGVIAGYASIFNNIDSHKDIIIPGAFKKTNKDKVKLLWQHKIDEPIGVITKMFEDDHGLYMEAQLLLDVEKAKEAYFLAQKGALSGLSIGYTATKHYWDKAKNARIIEEINLWEVSLVTFPANEYAEITEVKNNTQLKEAFDKAIKILGNKYG